MICKDERCEDCESIRGVEPKPETTALSDSSAIIRALAELLHSTYRTDALSDSEDERIKQMVCDARDAYDRLRAENARLREQRREDTFIIAERNAENASLRKDNAVENEANKAMYVAWQKDKEENAQQAKLIDELHAEVDSLMAERRAQAETIAKLREAVTVFLHKLDEDAADTEGLCNNYSAQGDTEMYQLMRYQLDVYTDLVESSDKLREALKGSQ